MNSLSRDSLLRKKRNDKEFDDILLESIDEALLALGEKSKTSIYYHLQSEFLLFKNEIPSRVSDFSNAIERIFGEAARFIEILIMKCLQKKVKCSYEWDGPNWLVPDLTFAKYVKLMKVWYEDNEPVGDVEVIIDISEKQFQH